MRDDTNRDRCVHAPFGDDYDLGLSPKALAQDRKRVARQVDALRGTRSRMQFDREILRAIEKRRSDRSDLLAVDVIRGRRNGFLRHSHAWRRGLTPIARGELLVRSSLRTDAPRIWAALEKRKFKAEEVAELDGRLLRLKNPKLSADKLYEIGRFVRQNGFEASVNYVAPLQPIVKGAGGPEHTLATRDFPPTFVQGREVQQQMRVAVIDTGIVEKPRGDGWLAGIAGSNNIDPLDAIPTTDGFLDFAAGHGTFAAGVVQQVAPQAEVWAYRSVDSDGVGSEVDIGVAMVQAAAEGAHIINLSLGAETIDDHPLLAIEVALDILDQRWPDVLVVAAAGNTGARRPVFPAATARVTAVGALDGALKPADWSSRGWWVDCSAIGQGVLSTYVEGTESKELDPDPDTWDQPDPWAIWSGTSFAAPQVSAAVARLCAEQGGLNPRDALKVLLGPGVRIPDFGVGLRILPGT